MRHVIIEGPDGAGKTRLARFICHRHTMAYHHEGPPPKDDVLGHYARLLLEAKRPTVFDRLHLGEIVYGPLLRGGCALSPRDLTFMNRLITGLGAAVVFCLPPWETCLENNRHKEELIDSELMLQCAYDAWRMVMQNHDFQINTQRYDYVNFPTFPLARYDALPDGVIGAPLAKVLFIGEQPNGSLDLPFFGSKHSSQFLHECVVEANIPEDGLALTNALDAKGNVRDLPFIISQMPHLETVVPLGRVALNQLERQGAPEFVKVTAIPHPQFWKRFHNGERKEYVRMLARTYNAA